MRQKDVKSISSTVSKHLGLRLQLKLVWRIGDEEEGKVVVSSHRGIVTLEKQNVLGDKMVALDLKGELQVVTMWN